MKLTTYEAAKYLQNFRKIEVLKKVDTFVTVGIIQNNVFITRIADSCYDTAKRRSWN